MKKRIDIKRNVRNTEELKNTADETDEDEDLATVFHFEHGEKQETDQENDKPIVGDFWKIRNGVHCLFAIIESENPIEVKYFEPTIKGNYHCLNDTIFEVFEDDLEEKITPPEIIQKGRRKYYCFE